MLKSILGTALTALILFASCKKEPAQTIDCTGVTPKYTTDIKAIVDANCATSGCHDAITKADGMNLTIYAEVKEHSSEDHFIGSIQHASGFSTMPKGAAKLSDANIQKIYCWIQNNQPE